MNELFTEREETGLFINGRNYRPYGLPVQAMITEKDAKGDLLQCLFEFTNGERILFQEFLSVNGIHVTFGPDE